MSARLRQAQTDTVIICRSINNEGQPELVEGG
jgi:hypothetical protein